MQPNAEESTQPFTTHVAMPKHVKFQLELIAEIHSSHRVDLGLYDEIIDLTKKYSNGRELKFSSHTISNIERASFVTWKPILTHFQ